MVEKGYEIVWTKTALQQMKQLYDYIGQDSFQNANKVVEDIAMAVQKAAFNPEIYTPDKYKTHNDGSYRAFEKHRYRIAYRFKNNIIRVLRVRHTSMQPKSY